MQARLKQTQIETPQSQKQAEDWLKRLAHAQRRVAEVENAMNNELTDIKEKYTGQAKPVNDEIDNLFVGIQAWSEAHRDELCQKGIKSLSIATGRIGWRKNPPSVRVSKLAVVIENLKRFGLKQFISTKEAINKDAILADKTAVEGIAGISINAGAELFFVEPFETEIEKAKVCK